MTEASKHRPGAPTYPTTQPVGDATPGAMERVFLSCSFCGHWEAGSRTKEQVAEWLRVHKAATLGVDRHGIDRQSTCPHPCGTPAVPVGDDTPLPPGIERTEDGWEMQTGNQTPKGWEARDWDGQWKPSLAFGQRVPVRPAAPCFDLVGDGLASYVPVGDDTPTPTAQELITKYLIDAPEQSDWPWEDHCDGLAGGIIVALKAHGYDLNRVGAAPDLTALPTAATIARYIDLKKLAWLRSDAIQIVLDGVVAALVRDTDHG